MLKKIQFLILIVSIIFASCGPKTRTITPLTETDKSSIKKVAIYINVNPELDAKMSTMKSRFYSVQEIDSSMGDYLGGCASIDCLLMPFLVGWMITEEAVRSNMDNTRENEFNEDLAEINMEKIMAENMKSILKIPVFLSKPRFLKPKVHGY